MFDESKHGMGCAEFDALLSEAIDGALTAERRERFDQHRAGCEACGTLFAEVSSGASWLSEVEEVEPPSMLVHNILARTSQADLPVTAAEPRVRAWERLLRQARVMMAPVLTPRFGMSMGMAFFSITLVLNMAQIRIADLTPRNLSHTFYSSQNKVMKYYENMRLVYEIESRVRDLRNASDESERQQKSRPNDKSHDQTQEQNQNQNSEPEQRHSQPKYSQGLNVPMLASLNGIGPKLGTIAKQRRQI